MGLNVVTNDAAALTDAELDELASMEDAFNTGQLSKAKEDWVLVTTARIGDKLNGFMFATLERIGGTPCVLIGLLSVKRSSKRGQVLRGLMNEAYHRALMAFPDEDVVVGSKFARPDAVEAFKSLDDLTPSPGGNPVGEERAWGRRLAKRFGVDGSYDAKAFTAESGALDGHIDYESADPESIDAGLVEMFSNVGEGGPVKIIYGWTMAEDLAKLGARS